SNAAKMRHQAARSRQLLAIPGALWISPGIPGPQVLGGTGAVTSFRSGRVRFNVYLLADSELADYVAIAIRIMRLQVIQKAAALAHEHQKATTGRVILRVGFEVFGELAN